MVHPKLGNVSRVHRTRQQARASYDRLSRWYGWLASSETPFRRKAASLLELKRGEKVLEIGFGTGDAMVGLTASGAWIAGIDLSFGMAQVARSRLRRQMQLATTLLCQADATTLPFEASCFDALLMTFTLELFDNDEILPVLEQCRRVLKPGGRMAVASLSLPDLRTWPVDLYEWFHHQFPALVDCRPIPLAALLFSAGFETHCTFHGRMWGLPVEIKLAGKPVS